MFSTKYCPYKVTSLHASTDLSQTPSPTSCVIVGGDDTSKEQSLPPYPGLHVQIPLIDENLILNLY